MTDRSSPDIERFTFGQPVENIAASDDNPIKRGFFVQYCGPSERMVEYASPQGIHTTPADNLRASVTSGAAEAREPIAWRYRFVTSVDGKEWSDWFIVDDPRSIPCREGQTVQPLYTSAAQGSSPSGSPVGWGGHLPGKIEP